MTDKLFEKFETKIYEKNKLKFNGVDGYDVYNCSMPFTFKGKEYIFGRVEKRAEWAESFIYLFEKTGRDEYTVAEGSRYYQLEDPYVTVLGDEIILGGTHVTKMCGDIESVYGYFYRGTDLTDLKYFTTGPKGMKDIRLVELSDGRVGVFSRPRSEKIAKLYGSESMIGFAVIDSIDDLNADVIENAELIKGIFENGQWGGCNQAYLFDNGKIGVIGHLSDRIEDENHNEILSYKNISFVFDPQTCQAEDLKIIAVRGDYPEGPAKIPALVDCAFTSGIIPMEDGLVSLYSGIGDCEEGRIVIDNPFENRGTIISKFGL